ncbi:MAG: acetyl-CoA acyltransferase [Bacteroidales bacterium]|jgi:acetyl-CoA acyltransferase|nr:acetyl-CoA acyltransferase [Bacteroidales bacterium]MDN5330753.1 acetyl-CoA acyltransferase [Bacteroidales bacterium]
MSKEVFICDAIRTPIGKYAGTLSAIRTDDLAAIPLKALIKRNPGVNWDEVDDIILGCANQAGEDNRNVARMALLLAGFSHTIPGVTVNRLCGSGMEAVGQGMRAIMTDDAHLIIAGGVESMSRAPFVMGKSTAPFARDVQIYDTTIGWRFINKRMQELYGTDSMIETAENLADMYHISREDQDLFAWRSQTKAAKAIEAGAFVREIIPVEIPKPKAEPIQFLVDEHPRLTSVEKLATLKPVSKPGGTVTAGNASGVNDGAAALLLASAEAVKRYNLTPLARIIGIQAAGVPPRIMGIGPVPATKKLLARLNLSLADMDILELNEAFAAQSLACIRELGLADDDPRINPLGGAIALGHPLGMSGARLVTTAVHQLQTTGQKRALCTMCIGVGQGIASVVERV